MNKARTKDQGSNLQASAFRRPHDSPSPEPRVRHPAWALQHIRGALRTEASAEDILTLQRAVGNQAVRSLLHDEGHVKGAAAHGLGGPAGPLPFRNDIQTTFGHHDISRVQAHTGSRAAEGAAAMGAVAFTSGDRIALPGTPSLHTAAHEAAHVVQQRSGVHLTGGVGTAGDRYERHADAVADLVVQGRSAQSLLDAHPGGAGAATGAVQRVEEKDKPEIGLKYKPDEYSGPKVAGKLNALWTRIKMLIQKKLEAEKAKGPMKQAVLDALKQMSVEDVVSLLQASDESTKAKEQEKEKAEHDVSQEEAEKQKTDLEDPKLGDAAKTVVNFNIAGLGSGRILLFQQPEKRTYDKLLAWVSHGFTISNGLKPASKPRSFGFVVPQYTTLERPEYTKDFYKKHIDKLAEQSKKEPLSLGKSAPDMAVTPHAGDLYKKSDQDTLRDVTSSCDVAILVDFVWAKDCKDEYKERKLYKGTPPLPELLEGIDALAHYDTMLMLTCRTPWTEDAGLRSGPKRQGPDDIYPAVDPKAPEFHPSSDKAKPESTPLSKIAPEPQIAPEPLVPPRPVAPRAPIVHRPAEEFDRCTLAFEGPTSTVTLKGSIEELKVQRIMHAYRPHAQAMDGRRAPEGPEGFGVFSAGPEGLHILKLSFNDESVARRLVQELQAVA